MIQRSSDSITSWHAPTVAKNVAGDCWLLPPSGSSSPCPFSPPTRFRWSGVLCIPTTTIPDPDESTFTKARQRLGVAPMREELFHDIAPVLAARETPGVFYRSWRLMGIDGATFDMPDTPDNAHASSVAAVSNQRSPNAFPHVRVMAGFVNSAPMPSSTSHCGPSTTANSAWCHAWHAPCNPACFCFGTGNFYGFDLIPERSRPGQPSAGAKSKPAN